jgi:anthranilate/para-aminobenzoate synthase component I
VWKENKAFVGVGAGIVYDSIPQREYEETMEKASACINALGKKNDINDR